MPDDGTTPKLPGPGAIVGGKYEIVGTIGKGGMGLVFEALHLRLRQRVAIKMLYPHVRDAPGALARFEREARAAGQLLSPHVARVLDVETDENGAPYIVMEFLEGNDLNDEIARAGRLPIAQVVDYVIQASLAIREAHALGIVHRDIKPANLFLTKTAEGHNIKVLDFGISKILSEADGRLTAAMTTMGSPVYMSPEQIRAVKEVDARVDIWGLGVTLFELLTGRPPHVGTTTAMIASILEGGTPKPSAFRKDLPEGLDEVVLKALEKEPDARYPDANSFAEALVPFASPEGVRQLRASQATPLAPVSSRRVPVPASSVGGFPAVAPGERNAATIVSVRRASKHDGTGKETGQSWTTASFARPGASRRRVFMVLAAAATLAFVGLALVSLVRRPVSAEPAAASLATGAPPAPSQPASPPPAVSGASPGEPGDVSPVEKAADAVPSNRTASPRRPAPVAPAPRRPAAPGPAAANPLHL